MHLVVQLGKNGVTEGFLQSLKTAFASREYIKISVLKAATRDREHVREMARQIEESLGKKFTARVLGYTIFLKKWRKARDSQK